MLRNCSKNYIAHFALFFVLLFFENGVSAEGFHYCTGKILDIITRASHEDTQVKIEGLNGYARLGFGGDANDKMHDRQFSMLLSAFMANKPVSLEFVDNTKSCSDDHSGVQIRYVRLKQSF